MPPNNKRLKKKQGSPAKPVVVLATVLSSVVLVLYFLSIVGVFTYLDNDNSNPRHLSLHPHIRSSPASKDTRKHNHHHHVDAQHQPKWRRPEDSTDKKKRRRQMSGAGGGDTDDGNCHSKSSCEDETEDSASVWRNLQIPQSTWPVTVRNETLMQMPHPVAGHPDESWTVPSFWLPPIHHNQLMPRDVAMQIGTCSVANQHGSHARGPDCPLHQRTIFMMIASYRDFQCRETVESIFSRATYPQRLRIAIVDQIVKDVDTECAQPAKPCDESPEQAQCKYAAQIDTNIMDAATAVGPVPARHVGHRMYRGEYYAMQLDAHVTFTPGWDVSLTLELEATGNEMAVLSTYLPDFNGALDENGNRLWPERPIMCNSYWRESNGGYHVHHSTQPLCMPQVKGMPQLQPWWSAGFSFSRGHFVVNVPYDPLQPMVFSGEEMSIAIRGWTIGYDYYTMEHSVCFHHYQESKETIAKREKVPTFWEHANKYKDVGINATKRLLGIVHMNSEDVDVDSWDHTDENVYGLGKVRQPEHLYRILGLNLNNHTMERHLCHFVNKEARMHRLFMPHLRSDGMGIDYNAPAVRDYTWKDDHPGKPPEDGDDGFNNNDDAESDSEDEDSSDDEDKSDEEADGAHASSVDADNEADQEEVSAAAEEI